MTVTNFDTNGAAKEYETVNHYIRLDVDFEKTPEKAKRFAAAWAEFRHFAAGLEHDYDDLHLRFKLEA